MINTYGRHGQTYGCRRRNRAGIKHGVRKSTSIPICAWRPPAHAQVLQEQEEFDRASGHAATKGMKDVCKLRYQAFVAPARQARSSAVVEA